MDRFALLDFQINGLGYHFKNLDLLQEALTHSLDTEDPSFPNQNRNYQRLQTIGNSVIKFTISQFVLQTMDVRCDEGELTSLKEAFIVGTMQKEVGEKLFERFKTGRETLFNYVRVGRSFKSNYFSQNITLPYEKLVRALMGAVYLDAGGIAGNGMQAATGLFKRIWGDVLGKLKVKENVQACFPKPSGPILNIWGKNGLGKQFIAKVEQSIGSSVSRENEHLLVEALIQTSFYQGNSLQPGQHLPNYERLEFLGDSVLGLIITELLWLEHPHDNPTTPLDHLITAKISGDAQAKIFLKLGLAKFVQRNVAATSGWKMHDDIVESIVGAIFVDGGGVAAKDFIVKTWGLRVNAKEPTLDDLQEKLGYKFRNKQFLIRALSHPNSCGIPNVPVNPNELNERSKKLREVLKYFGPSWIQFHATEYVLRSCSQDDSLEALVSHRKSILTEPTMIRIGSYLNLSAYISLSSSQRNRGVEPYILYEDIIQTIAGAVFKDMQEARIRMSFGNVFYRLWNPFLKICPRNHLLDNFVIQQSRHSLQDWQISEITGNIRHIFSNRHLLEQAVSEFSRLGMLRNNSKKLSFLGESSLDLAVRVYVAILCYMVLDDPGNGPRDLDFNSLHAHTLSHCLDLAEVLYELEVIREYSTHPSAVGEQRNGESDEELIKRIFGAVFVDLSERDADVSFSKWKQYFITHCEFISSNSREE